jgi:hypothetical protein
VVMATRKTAMAMAAVAANTTLNTMASKAYC